MIIPVRGRNLPRLSDWQLSGGSSPILYPVGMESRSRLFRSGLMVQSEYPGALTPDTRHFPGPREETPSQWKSCDTKASPGAKTTASANQASTLMEPSTFSNETIRTGTGHSVGIGLSARNLSSSSSSPTTLWF